MISSLVNNHFIFSLAYLADIFQQPSKVTLKLQGRGKSVVACVDTFSALVEKLDNWKRNAQAGNFACSRILP